MVTGLNAIIHNYNGDRVNMNVKSAYLIKKRALDAGHNFTL